MARKAEADREAPRRVGAGSVLGLLLLLVPGGLPAPLREVRAEVPRLPAPPVAPPPAADAPGPRRERLHVWLRDPGEIRIVFPGEDPSAASLAGGGPAWDEGRLAASAVLAAAREARSPFRADAAVAAAEDEGLDVAPDLETPEDALESLVARWVTIEVGYHTASTAWDAARLPEGTTLAELDPAARRALLTDPGRPRLDHTPLEGLADEVAARFPDHPVADRAAALALRAATSWGREIDPAEVAARLDAIADPGAWEAAASFATRAPLGDGAGGELLLDALRTRPAGRASAQVALRGLQAALRAGDPARAAGFLGDLRGLAGACAAPGSFRCTHYATLVREAGGRLSALGAGAPATWQEALTAAAWRCHLAGEPQVGVSRGEARWSGAGWTFGPWDAPTAVTSCLAGSAPGGPAPDGPLVVALSVEGDEAP